MSLKLNETSKKLVFVVILLLCCTPFIDPPLALLLGFIMAQTVGHPFLKWNSKATGWLLKISVVGLGFGMNLHHAIAAGKEGLYFTIFSIVITMVVGWLIGKWLKIEYKISYLISSGTAICGGSAIAAVSPIIKADDKQISVALGTVFILNSVALFVFPLLGHLLDMSQHQFGIWSAIAIHDTSSVVGAASRFDQYFPETSLESALQVATTIKLERALWIIPLSIITALMTKGESKKISIPYFIGFFILTMCISTFLPQFQAAYAIIKSISKQGLTVTLFLIGAGLSLKNIQAVGFKPMLQGVLLWLIISVISIFTILTI
jgi:uncharacterized integral membrane protein (TIGR00698 family)